MEIIGHKTRSMLDRYNIVNETEKRDAVRKTHLFRTPAQNPHNCRRTVRTAL